MAGVNPSRADPPTSHTRHLWTRVPPGARSSPNYHHPPDTIRPKQPTSCRNHDQQSQPRKILASCGLAAKAGGQRRPAEGTYHSQRLRPLQISRVDVRIGPTQSSALFAHGCISQGIRFVKISHQQNRYSRRNVQHVVTMWPCQALYRVPRGSMLEWLSPTHSPVGEIHVPVKVRRVVATDISQLVVLSLASFQHANERGI
jgi:hypothetical protein